MTIRLQVEYSIQFQAPHFKKDLEKLEQAQRRGIKIAEGLEIKFDERQFKEPGMFSLKKTKRWYVMPFINKSKILGRAKLVECSLKSP